MLSRGARFSSEFRGCPFQSGKRLRPGRPNPRSPVSFASSRCLEPELQGSMGNPRAIAGGRIKPAGGVGLLGTGAATGCGLDKRALGSLSDVAENGPLARGVGVL